MFDSEKSKQKAKVVLQQIQKHTNESLRSLARKKETLVKTAYTLLHRRLQILCTEPNNYQMSAQ